MSSRSSVHLHNIMGSGLKIRNVLKIAAKCVVARLFIVIRGKVRASKDELVHCCIYALHRPFPCESYGILQTAYTKPVWFCLSKRVDRRRAAFDSFFLFDRKKNLFENLNRFSISEP